MKQLKLLICLMLAVMSLSISSCSDDPDGLDGWYEHYETTNCYCYIHIKGKMFHYYHYAVKGKDWMSDKEIPGKSGWYCQSMQDCVFYREGDYLILDNGKKARIDGNKIDYFNRVHTKK